MIDYTEDLELAREEVRDLQGKLIKESVKRINLQHQNKVLKELVEYAAENSTVTTSDEPGCFWCDHVKHTRDCPAKKVLKEKL